MAYITTQQNEISTKSSKDPRNPTGVPRESTLDLVMSTAGAGSSNGAEEEEQQQLELEEEDQRLEGEGSTNPRRCAACKYLRRRCGHDCVLAPFFPVSQPLRYACVHRVFGASNVARLLQSLPAEERGRAAETMAMEAEWRVQDPVYGCTGMINRLQEEISAVQCELARSQAQLAIAHLHGAWRQVAPALPPPPPPPVVDAVQTQGQEAPPLDPDDFLDLDGF